MPIEGISVSFIGKDAWLARLTRANREAMPLVSKYIEDFSIKARAAIQAAIPKPPRDGKRQYGRTTLADSIEITLSNTPTTITTQFSSDLPYASIVEQGGSIDAHTIMPTSGKVLAYSAALSSKTAAVDMLFSPKVEIPLWTYPGKHYIANTLVKMREQFREAVITGINESDAGP